jgi:acyl dehydratase
MHLPATEVVSGWVEITQERILRFAEATEDRQWIHLDAIRAARESPYGTTVAHGFLTLSLLPHLLREAVQIEGVAMGVNYGLNRVRFVAPVPAGSRIRGRFAVASTEPAGAATRVTWNVTVECDAAAKPCCVAEWVTMYYAGAAQE